MKRIAAMAFAAAIMGTFASGNLGSAAHAAPVGSQHAHELAMSATHPLPQTQQFASTSVLGNVWLPSATTNWSRRVWTTGGQAHIDRCVGAVKVPFSNGYSVVAEHNHCGGAWVLKVQPGHTVRLTGVVSGYFKAVNKKDVLRGASSAALVGMGRSGLVLQTCLFNSNKMRLVGLDRIAAPKPAPMTYTCGGKKATIVGTEGSDRIRGTSGPDVIVGRGGNDVIDGRGGNDLICGGSGNDTIRGGSGHDKIWGGTGNDRMWGGSGNDQIWGGSGSDRMWGGTGADRMWGGSGADRVWGGSGVDRIWGGTGSDRIYGGSGKDYLWPGSGNNLVRP